VWLCLVYAGKNTSNLGDDGAGRPVLVLIVIVVVFLINIISIIIIIYVSELYKNKWKMKFEKILCVEYVKKVWIKILRL